MAFRPDRENRGVDNRWEGEVLRREGRGVVLRGDRFPFGDQEAAGGDAQRGVMMKATPTWALVVPEAKLLLDVLAIALDPPAQLGGVEQGAASNVRGQCG